MNKEELAEKLFEAPYSHLSAWGQRHVDETIRKATVDDTPRTTNLHTGADTDRLRQDNERLARQLESSRLENLELWDENSELKSQLTELQAQFNPRSS